MEKVLFVLLEEFSDWELASLAAALNEEPENGQAKRYLVETVSLKKEPIKSIGGITVLPDYALNEVPTDFSALILIGGNSWRKKESEDVMELVHYAISRNAVLGAICDAAYFIGSHGILNEVKHTANFLEELQEVPLYTGEKYFEAKQAVRDGSIVTANGSAIFEFGKEVMLAMDAFPKAEILEWYDFFKLGYYEAKKKHPS
ncbi:DJ-1/PfpI family protein [Listeria fleischmannii]|uniref:DJ-1/PfpI family protein n=1 Tax=Listeria fleischmannii TaxID=1069827 RepID=UPI00162575F3|nr:DJ-1/PfpI family protein [Listeria fleischmannii]MBC1417571.1 glutamine amidotransferase [Listeria fleischmannii]